MIRLTAGIPHPFRPSHGRLLDLIPDGGIRPSAIASDVWITKQAVGVRLREMQELGWVSTTRDPADGRAVIVKRTAAGSRIHRAARQAIAKLEAEWAEAVGPDRFDTFRAVIDELGAANAADRV